MKLTLVITTTIGIPRLLVRTPSPSGSKVAEFTAAELELSVGVCEGMNSDREWWLREPDGSGSTYSCICRVTDK